MTQPTDHSDLNAWVGSSCEARRTLAQEMNVVLIQERLIATLSSFFGALALLLACVALHGGY